MNHITRLGVLAACFFTGLILSNITLKEHADVEAAVTINQMKVLKPASVTGESCIDCDPAVCLACNVSAAPQK